MMADLAGSLGLDVLQPVFWMPLLMMTVLSVLILGGALFDGFDIGVGVLLRMAPPLERPNLMVVLSPWRDANEFWLLLAVGLFMAAFPLAWSAVFAHLFVPVMITMLGVMLRSVSFEFRIRASSEQRPAWMNRFWFGSVMTAVGHGMLLANIVTGYQQDTPSIWFSLFIGLCAVAAYALLGASWLVMRLQGAMHEQAIGWARHAIRWTAAGMVAVSVALGLANPAIFYKWSNTTSLMLAAPVWFLMLGCFVGIDMVLNRLTQPNYRKLAWVPFSLCLILFVCMLGGLAYSMFPYVILDNMTLWDAAASENSLRLVLAASVVAAPVMVIFNLMSYRSLFGRAP
jgi:cytochrome d ubiquinol oxidase subunit II